MFATAGKKNTTHQQQNRLRVLPFKLRTKKQMTKIKQAGLLVGILLASIELGFCQSNLQFTAVAATDEHAIRLTW
jgi:hypothetical protein